MDKVDSYKLVRFIKKDTEKVFNMYDLPGYRYILSKTGDYFIGIPTQKQKSKVLLTAHIDISCNTDGEMYYDKKRQMMFGKVSGDDRAGCYGVYEICKNAEYKPYFILFDGEESGMNGSRTFIKEYKAIRKHKIR